MSHTPTKPARALPGTPRKGSHGHSHGHNPGSSGGEKSQTRSSLSESRAQAKTADGSDAGRAQAAVDASNLWQLALKMREAERSAAAEERYMLVCGSKEGGMSTIIRRFLERDDKPKPTVALEYTFGRYAKSSERNKDLVHIWELGGGTSLLRLVETPISSTSIKTLTVVMVLDLSKPNALWHIATTLLSAIQSQVDQLLRDLEARGSQGPAYLRKKAWQRYGPEPPADKSLLQPLAVPLLILGSKYDLFQNLESEKRKIVSRALRFLAHYYGATLLFVTDRDESLMNRCRALLADLAFRVAYKSSTTALDHNRPLIVPAGSDDLASIGPPPVAATTAAAAGARTPLALWKVAMDSLFPPEAQTTTTDTVDPSTHPDYRESMIDAARAERDEELARARKRAERRAQEASVKEA